MHVASPRAARTVALLVPLLLAAIQLEAQCPDGSPLPCRSNATARPIDANRIAILPFRASGADPAVAHLRNGLVELLAPTFTGEIGPAAVEPGEALAAWTAARLGAEPSNPDAARRIARQLGAGKVLYASIVGSPASITVSASILNSRGGAAQPPVQVQGSADSLPALVSALATRLLGVGAGVPPTISNDAAAAYLSGMAAFRVKPGDSALAHLTQAVKLDSTFLLPAFQILLMRVLEGPTGPFDVAMLRRLWLARQRLPTEQRLLLEVIADSSRLRNRMPMLARMEKAIPFLQNSAEALNIYGDLLYHVGASSGRKDWREVATFSFARALELNPDVCPCANAHLIELAFMDHDARAVARRTPQSAWQRYLVALLRGNPAHIRAARMDHIAEEALVWRFPGALAPWLVGVTLPQHEVDSIITTMQALASTDLQRRVTRSWSGDAFMKGGRPNRNPALPDSAMWRSRLAYAMEIPEDFDRIREFTRRNPALQGWDLLALCDMGLATARTGDTATAGVVLARLPRLDRDRPLSELLERLRPGPAGLTPLCAEVLAGTMAGYAGTPGPLWRADSAMRANTLNCCDNWNHEIGIAFAGLGEYGAAAAATARRWNGVPANHPHTIVPSLRLEGRWATLAGDTASAIRAYRHYLRWRESPEPAYLPQRDSVRAELAALLSRRPR